MKIIHDNESKQVYVDTNRGEDTEGLADMDMVVAELKKQGVKVGKFKKVNYSTHFFARYIFEASAASPQPKKPRRTRKAKLKRESE